VLKAGRPEGAVVGALHCTALHCTHKHGFHSILPFLRTRNCLFIGMYVPYLWEGISKRKKVGGNSQPDRRLTDRPTNSIVCTVYCVPIFHPFWNAELEKEGRADVRHWVPKMPHMPSTAQQNGEETYTRAGAVLHYLRTVCDANAAG